MAVIKPFKGYVYNREKIANPELIVAPPYDVITPEQQSQYYEKHPQNIIRLILGKEEPDDNEKNNKYTRAARYLANWQEDNILKRCPAPAIYFYVQDFTLPSGELRRRKGFIGLFKLEEFSSGVILPHERTLSKPKVDRLNLRLASHGNFNPIFSIYSDPQLTIEKRIDEGEEQTPYLDVTDDAGVRHKLYVVDDRNIINDVKKVMEDKTVLIADGHHRYETALNYRNIMRERYPDASEDAPFNYTLMYLTNMDDAGLVILPTHRLVKKIKFYSPEFIEKAQKYFDIEAIPFTSDTDLEMREKVFIALKNEAEERYLCGMVTIKQGSYLLLRLKDYSLLDELVDKNISTALRNLDANIMEFLIFNHILGISCSDPRFEENIKFAHTEDETINLVKTGNYEVGFFVNPTRIEQVKEVVTQGEVMPQKSTYFFPKLLSGLVTFQVNPKEIIE